MIDNSGIITIGDDMEKEVERIIEFIRDYYKKHNLGGVVLGISGGKDSAVVAALFTKALGSENVVGLTLPCHSKEIDKIDAKKISDYYGFKLLNIDLTNTFDTFKEEIKKIGDFTFEVENSDINLKPRLRMSACYYMAALLSKLNNKTYLVAGTSNKSELFVGYFTKGGDSVCDISTIADFTKNEVIEIGEVLNVPKDILYKEPSDGLSDKVDEEKLGVSYQDIDTYMENPVSLNENARRKIKELHDANRHKFEIPTYKRLKVGVYVGSFDPVHLGHKNVINYLTNNNVVDKLIIVPTGDYWDKKLNCSLKDRINMLKFYQNDKVVINNTLNNLEYTYKVLDELGKEYDNLYLVIGADNIKDFHLWKNVDEILKNKIIVLGRNNINIEEYIKKYDKNRFILCNDFEEFNVSSTQIRDLIKENKYSMLYKYLDSDIIKYIVDNKLYN